MTTKDKRLKAVRTGSEDAADKLKREIAMGISGDDAEYLQQFNLDMVSEKQANRKIKKILEIGTFTGLSTLSMSLALPDDGSITALDKNQETSKTAVNFFKKAYQENKIKLIIAPALESLKNLNDKNQKFDLVFIDADKENYKNYFNHSINLIDKDGLIVIDNVLWHGEVVDNNKQDKLTVSIREFNSYVNKDKRVENLIIPVGDGLSVCRKL